MSLLKTRTKESYQRELSKRATSEAGQKLKNAKECATNFEA